jgi:hypothetical protein
MSQRTSTLRTHICVFKELGPAWYTLNTLRSADAFYSLSLFMAVRFQYANQSLRNLAGRTHTKNAKEK